MKCQWILRVVGGRKAVVECGNKAIGLYLGAAICEEHSKTAIAQWGEKNFKKFKYHRRAKPNGKVVQI